MTTTTIILFTIYHIFYGLLSYYHYWTMRQDPVNVAHLDYKLWMENTPLSGCASLFLLLTRISGIAYLVYLGFKTVWFYPLGLFVFASFVMTIVNGFVRMRFGHNLPALFAFVVLPPVGAYLWITT